MAGSAGGVWMAGSAGRRLEGERMLGDTKGVHRQIAVQWRGRGEPHGDPLNPAGVVDAQ